MSTAETIVIQCPACEQKYRWHVAKAGQPATCQKCQHTFPAIDIENAIPPEFDDSIPSQREHASPKIAATESKPISRETELRLEGKRLANELSAEKRAPRVTSGPTALQGWLIIALLVALVAAPFVPRAEAATEWEYRIENPSDTLFTDTINRYGSEGWELVTARRATGEYKSVGYELIFKRQKRK